MFRKMHLEGCLSLALLLLMTCTSLAYGNFYSHSMTSISGETVDLSQYTGKVSLVVNVASECGYTDGHYKALVRLHEQMSLTDKFTVLAFPSNQFGAQEPKDNAAIFRFARESYQVNFPMFSKINVIEDNVPEAWKYLIDKTGQAPTWNFWKYLVDHKGNVIEAWGPWTEVHAIHHTVHQAVDKAVEAQIPADRDMRDRQDL